MAKKVECNLIVPVAPDATHEGCAVRLKRRHITISKGQCGTAQWEMRFPDGQTADMSDCINDDSISESASVDGELADVTVLVRFQGCDRGCVLAEVEGTVTDASAGIVQFEIPTAVCQAAGIYQFQLGLFVNSVLTFTDGGIMSVEHGMWGDSSVMTGPPTLEEIRFHLRDRAAENDLLQAVEFDDAEILEAIRHPVFEFNETPPTLNPFTCNNFPFRYHWRNAIVCELMKVANHHYLRNKLQVSSGGLSTDDKNKNREYLELAALYDRDWKTFIREKKVELNARLGFGSLGSDYGNYSYY